MSVRLGAATVVQNVNLDGKMKILLGRRSQMPNKGRWVIPGGKVEVGESWRMAAARELQEETNISSFLAKDVQPYVLEIIDDDQHRVILVGTTTLYSNPQIQAGSDLEEVRWFNRDELAAILPLISPPIVPVLRHFGWL